MFGELSKLFDRNFAVGFFLPVFIGLSATLVLIHRFIYRIDLSGLKVLDFLVWTTVFGLVCLIGGIMLLAINRDLYRFMEGYGSYNPMHLIGPIEKFRYERLSLDPDLTVVVDYPANVQKLNDEANRRGLRLNVLVYLDPGMGRTGVSFKDGLALGKVIHSLPGLRLRGVQCYAGHVQHLPSFEERVRTSLGWMEQAADVVRKFRGKGLPCEIFTGSGTGTSEIDARIPDLTDLQAGSYTLMDAEYLGIGSSQNPSRFEKFAPALTLLTSVINTNHADHVTVDAGLKALYHDGATPYVLNPASADLKYEWRGDEHGQINFPAGSVRFELGDVLELVVSHCDPTVNLFDALCMTRNDQLAVLREAGLATARREGRRIRYSLSDEARRGGKHRLLQQVAAAIDEEDRILKVRSYPDMDLSKLLYERHSTVAQPSSLIRRRTLDAAGGVDRSLSYCMDYDLWIRLLRQAGSVNLGDAVLSGYRLHTRSKTVGSYRKMALEKIAVNRRYTGDRINRVIYAHYWYIVEDFFRNVKRKWRGAGDSVE